MDSSHHIFLRSAPVAFRRVALETSEWTSRDSNHLFLLGQLLDYVLVHYQHFCGFRQVDSPACKLQFNCLPRLNVCNDLAEAMKALDGKKSRDSNHHGQSASAARPTPYQLSHRVAQWIHLTTGEIFTKIAAWRRIFVYFFDVFGCCLTYVLAISFCELI